MQSLIRTLLTAAALACAVGNASAETGADLNISPKRVVLGDSARAASVYLFNRGDAPATYRIELVDRVMLSDGQIRTIEEAGQTPAGREALARFKAASPMLQYTPRRVTLEPGQTQTIRLRFLQPNDLGAGEYRTTLTVSALPPENAGLTIDEATALDPNQLSLKVVSLFGVSIPLIVRVGQVEARAAIESAALVDGRLQVALGRTGNGSLYGDVELHRGTENGPVIAAVKGIGIYGEIDRRAVEIPVTAAVKRGEKLRVVYRDDDANPGVIIASREVVAP